jgi:hypothetical protein
MTERVKPSLGCGYAVSAAGVLGGAALVILAEQTGMRVFGGVLIVPAIVYAGVAKRIVAASEAEERLRTQFAAEPWKWRKEWRGPAIFSNDHRGVWAMAFFAFLWNVISLPIAWQVFTQPKSDPAVYLVAIFPLIGVGFLIAAGYKLAQWRKYGRTRFVPSGVPGVIGGYLGGVIEVPARVVPEGDARVALRCIRQVTTGSGKHRRTVEHVLWEREERIPLEKWQAGAGHTDIPVLFYIPAGLPQTDVDDSSNQVIWRLSAKAEVRGVDFETTFAVPVFPTGETVPAPENNDPLLEVYRRDGAA